jgi:hypothetical protein
MMNNLFQWGRPVQLLNQHCGRDFFKNLATLTLFAVVVMWGKYL